MHRSRRAQGLLALALVTAAGTAVAQDVVPTRPDQPIDTATPPAPPAATPEPTPNEAEKKESPAALAATPAPPPPSQKQKAAETPPPARPELETSDELDEPGYLPGYRPYMGLGTSPYVPRLGAFPSGVTPSFAAPTPSDAWLFTWKGYMSASLQVSIEQREDPSDGQSKTVLHTPPNIVEEYAAFPSTNSLPGNWIGSSFVYGNNVVSATVSVDTWQPTRATQNYGLGSQYFINNAFLSFRVPPFERARLALNVGFFGNNYGALGRYGGGFYTNPLVGTLQGAGEQAILEYDVTDSVILVAEHGFMGTGGPRVGFKPNSVIAGTGNGGSGGDTNPPAAYVHHAHVGIVRKGDIQFLAQLHFLTNWSQDDRVQRSLSDGRCDLLTTPEIDECYWRDGRMRVLGFDAKMLSNAYGVLGIGGSYIDASYAFPLKGMTTFAGEGDRVTSAWLGADSEGTGKIWAAGIAYNLSVAALMLSPEPFDGQAPDIVINAGLNIGGIKSDIEPFDGRVRHKFGADVLYTPLRYVGVGVRADRVVPASDDPEQTFHVIAPRLQFKTDWTSHEAIVLSYVKWFLGPHTHYDGLNPRSSARIDDQMFTLNFNMWW